MDEPFSFFADVTEAVDIPSAGITSRPIFNNETLRVVLFGFAPGEDMTEHTTSMEAMLYFCKGEAEITLGEKKFEARPGSWMRMEPRLPHSIHAKTPMVMLLTLLKKG